jgi:hypothetical protein
VDFLTVTTGPLDLKKKNLVLVVTDHFTHFAQAFAAPDEKANTVAKVLWENYFSRFGFPGEILTDQGPGLDSELVRSLCDLAGIDKKRTTPYHPETNGAVEKFNSTLLNMLGTLEGTKKAEWKKHLATLTHAYNCTRNSVTGYTPYELFYGRRARLPLDVEFGLFRARDNHRTVNAKGYLKGLKAQLQEAFTLAENAENKNKDKAKVRFDRKATSLILLPGDLVLLHKPKRTKVDPRWEDTVYEVHECLDDVDHVYKIKPRGQTGPIKTVNRRKLLPVKLKTWSREERGQPVTILKRPDSKEPETVQDAASTTAEGHGQPGSSCEEAPLEGPMTRGRARAMEVAVQGMQALRRVWDREVPLALVPGDDLVEEID